MASVRSIFEAALARPAAEREALVREMADGDLARVAQVQRLLALDAAGVDTGDLGPAADRAAALLEERALIGVALDRYRIVAPLGAGGMGRVFVGERIDGQFEQRVAVKFIEVAGLAPATRARLIEERRHLGVLRHPYICRILDAGLGPQDQPYVVMELVEGQPLVDYCDQQRLGIDARLAVFRRVLAAVRHAHAALIVHCDLKSSNILVDRAGLPKLLDFGIARPLSRPDPGADEPQFLSPASAAPEQFRGEAVSVATDIYALGLLLYRLLAGREPFELYGLEIAAIEALTLETAPPPMVHRAGDDPAAAARLGLRPGAWRRRLAGDLEAIVQQCLAKDPARRYASVDQLDADLAAVLAHQPIAARADQRGYRLRCFLRRHRSSVAFAATLVLGLTTAVVVLWRQQLEVSAQRNQALLERDRAEAALGILEDAFLAADPSESLGVDTRIGDVLGAAEPAIDTVAERQPGIAASLYRTLAEIHSGLRSDGRAAALAHAARTHAELAHSGPVLVPYWILEARTLIDNGRFDAAEGLLTRAAAETSALPPEWYIARSRLVSFRNSSADAIADAERAVAMTESRGPTDRIATAAQWQLAEAQRSAKDPRAALATLDRMLEWQRQGDGEHPRALITRLRRLVALEQAGELEKASADAVTLIAAVDARFGPHSVFAATARTAHGRVLRKSGALAPALARLDEALAIQRDQLGPRHPTTVMSEYNLAVAQWADSGRAASTEEHLRNAFTNGLRTFGASSNIAMLYRTALAQFLNDAGRGDAALAVLLEPDPRSGYSQSTPGNQARFREQLAIAHRGADCPKRPRPTCSEAAALLEQTAPPADHIGH